MQSRLLNFVFGSLLGLAIGMCFVVMVSKPAIAHAQDAIRDQAQTIDQQKKQIEYLQLRLDADDKLIIAQKGKIDAALANPAAQALAQTGHVMTEAQCRAWMGVFPAVSPARENVATVLYESGKASLNVSLLPLPGAPRIAISPNAQLAPRWIIPGRIQPQIVGETRSAMYYYFDSQSSQWSGPFAPERIAQ